MVDSARKSHLTVSEVQQAMANAAAELIQSNLPAQGTQISMNKAAERYDVSTNTIWNWVYRDHSVAVLVPGKGRGSKTLIDERDVALIIATYEVGKGYRRKVVP